MLAALLSQPAIQLSQDEARGIAAAASNVSRHYDMRTSQKALDWGMLGITLVGVYGPRIAVVVAQRRGMIEAEPAGGVSREASPAPTNGAVRGNGSGPPGWSAADPFA